MQWLWKHPDYTPMDISYGKVAGAAQLWTDKTATESLYALVEKDGKVDPAKLKELDERYLKDTGRTLANDLPDLYKNIAQKQRGSKGKRIADNPNSGSVPTEEDYRKVYENSEKMKHLRGVYSRMVEELSTGRPLTPITPEDLKLLEQMEKDGIFKKKGGISLYKNKMKRG